MPIWLIAQQPKMKVRDSNQRIEARKETTAFENPSALYGGLWRFSRLLHHLWRKRSAFIRLLEPQSEESMGPSFRRDYISHDRNFQHEEGG